MNLKSTDRDVIARFLNDRLQNPVRIIFVSQVNTHLDPSLHTTCQWCSETEDLLKDFVSLNNGLSLEQYDYMTDEQIVRRYEIDKIPAIIPRTERDAGIRIFGIPAGYEFSTLLNAVVDVSRGRTALGEKTKERIRDLSGDVHLQVFISPTCPFCPPAVRLAHQMAIEGPRVRADMVELQEFPHLAQKYEIQGVPKTVINETSAVEGAAPESLLLLHVLKASGDLTQEEEEQFSHYGR